MFSVSFCGFCVFQTVDEGHRSHFCYEQNTRRRDRVLGGGPRGTRTLDLLNAIETRSQLRHGPISFGEFYHPWADLSTKWTWRDSNPRPLQCD